MPSPFPGMDPYLEDPEIWTGFHAHLAVTIREVLGPRVAPDYWVDVERWILLTAEEAEEVLGRIRPDVVIAPGRVPARRVEGAPAGALEAVAVEAPILDPIEQIRLVIRRRGKDREVVTVIEIMSPTNKVGPGREAYLKKRREVLATRTSLVEIDLLRAGQRVPVTGKVPATDYTAFVFRGWERPRGWVYGWNVSDALPDIAIPLLRQDGEVMLPLGAAVGLAYDRGLYRGELEYGAEADPPLGADRAAWADGLLREAGLRR